VGSEREYEYNLSMTNQTDDVLKEKDKVQVLLHEYDTLRTEGIYRNSAMFQLLAAGALLFVFLMQQQSINFRSYLSLAAFWVVIPVFSWFLGSDIYRAGKRLRELGTEINRRAGEELLVWETSTVTV
jgi:Flp pilus assembly protein TadB